MTSETQTDDGWNKVIVSWRPREHKRSRGRPEMRWADDIKKLAGSRRMNIALSREEWKRCPKLDRGRLHKWIGIISVISFITFNNIDNKLALFNKDTQICTEKSKTELLLFNYEHNA